MRLASAVFLSVVCAVAALGQQVPSAAAPGAVPSEAVAPTDALKLESVWDFVAKGGPTMIAIGLCSMLALTVIVERFILLRRRNIIPPHFVSALAAVGENDAKALELCKSDPSPAASILAAIFRNRGRSVEHMEKSVRDAGSRALVSMRRRMRLLSALPQVSTMLGLLGTIFGMIKTFQAVAASGQTLGKTEVLAKGIFEAWTNTAAGLLVAIPVLVAYHVLMGRIDERAVELDRLASEWLEREEEETPVVRKTIVPAMVSGGSQKGDGVVHIAQPEIAIAAGA